MDADNPKNLPVNKNRPVAKCTLCQFVGPSHRENFGTVKATGLPKSHCRQCNRNYTKSYAAANPNRVAATQEKRKQLSNRPLAAWLHLLLVKQKNKCRYCETETPPFEVDHWIAVNKGGSDELENLVASCRMCNRNKRDMSGTDFLKWRKKLMKNYI